MDSRKDLMIDVNEWETAFDVFIQEWVRHNTASTSQLEPSRENVGASSSHFVEASSSNPLGSLHQNSLIHTPSTTLNPELTF